MCNFHENLLHIELPMLPSYYPCFPFHIEFTKIWDGLSLMGSHIYETSLFTFVSFSLCYLLWYRMSSKLIWNIHMYFCGIIVYWKLLLLL